MRAATIRDATWRPKPLPRSISVYCGTLHLWSMRSESVEHLIDFVQSGDSFVQTGGPRYEGELLPDRPGRQTVGDLLVPRPPALRGGVDCRCRTDGRRPVDRPCIRS